ncbi:phage tail tape measure protein [Lysobacter firmicutimachus]|uniref:Phage tail tape measure protein n=1 Tax=Lysobacter firmicutimachus TaxID=1792846 RepID=A0AAU8MR24_9GAMM
MSTAGSIVVDLLMRTGSFITDSARAEKQMKQLEKAAHSLGRSVGNSITSSLAGMAAGFLSLQSGLQFFNDAINQADRLDELSARLDISTEKLSEWGYAAKMTGTDLESLTGSLTKFSKNIVGALDPNSTGGKVFKALGIDVKDAEGRIKSVESLLPQVADRFKELDNTTLETALAMELFGKSGADLLEFLNNGSGGLDKFAERARRLGIVIDSETSAKAAAFKDEVDKLRAATQGFATKIAAELLPDMTKLVQLTTDFTTEGGKAEGVAKELRDTVSSLSVMFHEASEAVEAFKEIIDFGGLGDNAKSQLRGLIDFATGTAVGFKGAYEEIAGFVTGDTSRAAAGRRKRRDGNNQSMAGLLGMEYLAPDEWKDVITSVQGYDWSDVTTSSSVLGKSKRKSKREAELGWILGGGSGSKGKDPAEEVERQVRALKEMQRATEDWTAALNGRSNPILEEYRQRLQEITASAERFKADGLSTAQIDTFTEKMRGLAEALKAKDLAEFQRKFKAETDELAAAVLGTASPALVKYNEDLYQLDEQMKQLLLSQELYQGRLEVITAARHRDATQMFKDYRFEIDLLGQTREAQELLNAARYLGADAATAQGESAIAALKEYQDLRRSIDDQIEAMDGLRDAARGFLVDLKDGKGVWDSLTDAANHFADVLFRIAANNVVEDLFGQQGSAAGGSAGWLGKIVGWFTGAKGGGASAAPSASFASAFGNNTGWLFGGGKAGGGDVFGNRAYLVGEMGPELFVPRTAGSVLPADMTRTALRQGGPPSVINFHSSNHFNGLPGRQTMQQSELETGRAVRRAMARTGR